MAEDDKTYCGRDDRSHVDAGSPTMVSMLAKKLAVTEQDIRDAMEQVGDNPERIEAFFHDKETLTKEVSINMKRQPMQAAVRLNLKPTKLISQSQSTHTCS